MPHALRGILDRTQKKRLKQMARDITGASAKGDRLDLARKG